MLYKAFISYSHAADNQLAPALQSALRRIGKPWYRRSSFRIFLDKSSLSANPALWDAIEVALAQSEYLILLDSTSSAQSEWAGRELDWWLTHRDPASILIVVTDGDVEWRPGDRDFDWEHSTALNNRLRGRFPAEPLWVDLRGARTDRNFSLRHKLSATPCCKLPRRCMANPERIWTMKICVITGRPGGWRLSEHWCLRRWSSESPSRLERRASSAGWPIAARWPGRP